MGRLGKTLVSITLVLVLLIILQPSVLVNCPQFFCSIRNCLDTRILTSRNSRQEFAGFAAGAQGLRVKNPKKGTAQRHLYFAGDMNFLLLLTMSMYIYHISYSI
jgi:hypothetical protein